MEYISTRGQIAPVSFQNAVMMGLADDGGLLLPNPIPSVGPDTLAAWRELDYQALCLEIMDLFVDDISSFTLNDIVSRSYSTFDTKEVTPLVYNGEQYILELFHGPTYAFKDIALQFLGNLFSWLLEERGEIMNILGATSGDTGSAAIYGVRGKDNINIFILHPRGRVSPIQALQMTTVPELNVFNIAVEGTFDDCQSIVKEIFNDLEFKSAYRLGSINSINWARVLAQVVYYVYATLKLQRDAGAEHVHFSVPTGNFGDIFAGYVAKKLIQPAIGRLILATNENNILTRFVLEGRYAISGVVPTISPSMDIQIASNFERYLYYLYNKDAQRVRKTMEEFSKTGELVFSREEREQVRKDFASASIDQDQTLKTIRECYKSTGYVLDPHTAVGVAAAQKLASSLDDQPVVCLATAHPAKFPDAVRKAIGRDPEQPEGMKGLENLPSRCRILPADVDVIKGYVRENALKQEEN